MFGFTILFVLTIWITITVLVAVLGYRWGGKLGALLGFMLTMGGWFIYWVLEYAYIQHKVTKLCEMEGGVTVYVTPEEWRRQIGEEEWKRSIYVGEANGYVKDDTIFFKNNEYHLSGQINQRLMKYDDKKFGRSGFVFLKDFIIYDPREKQVLYHERLYSMSAPNFYNSTSGWKFWLNFGISECNLSSKKINYLSYNSK